MVRSGARFRSQVCETQVIVVKATGSLDDLRCGGAAMIAIDGDATDAALDPELATGAALGKRYVDVAGGEVLVTRAGIGTLSVGATPMVARDGKALPASD